MHKVDFLVVKQWLVFAIYMIVFGMTHKSKDSIPTAIFLIAICLLLIYFEIKRTKRYNSPILIWYIFWLIIISIGRVDLRVYKFGSTWNDSLFSYVIISTITFFLSFWLAELENPEESIWSSDRLAFDGDKLLNILRIGFYIAILSFILNIIFTGTIPQLSHNTNIVRATFVVTVFYQVINILRCLFIFVPIAIKFGSSVELKRDVLIAASTLFFLEMLSGWRGYTFQTIIMIVTSMFFTTDTNNSEEKRKNRKRLIYIGVFSFIFIAYIAVTRSRVEGSIGRKIRYAITIIYLYIAPNFLNFQKGMNLIIPKGFPLYTTEAIWSIFISPSKMPGYENIAQSIGAFNVNTFMLQPYADMGLFGVVLWSFIIAFMSGISYLKSFQSCNFVWISLSCILNCAIFNMHNGFFLRASSTIIWMIFASFLQKCIMPSGGQPPK